MKNLQLETWTSEFGIDYTDRNVYSPQELDKLNIDRFGITKTALNELFLKNLDLQDKNILEVGCNVGNQLRLMQSMGYKNLYGIEPQYYAVEKSKKLTEGINIIKGSGFDIPYKDNYFDLVFTHGVLIHVSPENINSVMDEIYRVSGKFIWGLEYYSNMYEEINYRGNDSLLWKGDFAKIYMQRFPDLELVREERYKYSDNENNTDSMFLLKKA